jgi:PIN domain nuclease of toxin-antitoxin system
VTLILNIRIVRVDVKGYPQRLRKILIAHGYTEISIAADHIFAVETLPLLHKDPFDRLLVAQDPVEGMLLLTSDATVSQYRESVLSI